MGRRHDMKEGVVWLSSPFCLAEAVGLETLLVVISAAVVGVLLCLGASSTGDHQPPFPPPNPNPKSGDGNQPAAMTRIEHAAWIDAHSAFTPARTN